MKKKVRNKGFVYFFAFMFLALIAFAGLGAYSGGITGTQVASVVDTYGFGEIGKVMEQVLKLPFDALIKPIFNTIFGDEYYGYAIKVMLIIILSLILSFGARMIFKDNKKTANIIAVIISIISVVALPKGFIEGVFGTSAGGGSIIGTILGLLIALGLILLLLINLIGWKAKGFSKIIKIVSLLGMIPLISWIKIILVPTLNFSNGGDFVNLIFTLLLATTAIMFFIEVIGGLIFGSLKHLREGKETSWENVKSGWDKITGKSKKIEAAEKEAKVSKVEAQKDIKDIKDRTSLIQGNITTINNLILNGGFPLDNVARNLAILERLLINEERLLSKDMIERVVNSFDPRKRRTVEDALNDLLNENSNLMRFNRNLVKNNGKPTKNMGQLRTNSTGDTIANRLNDYLEERKIFINMMG